MVTKTRAKQIDALMEQASEALAGCAYFEAEQHAAEALSQAREARDFGHMARIILPLQEARRQRLQQALDVGEVTIIDAPIDEDYRVQPGCYHVQPPLVAADARRFRLAAEDKQVPIAVVCREPLTALKQWPIVAISPGVTLRTKIDPPTDPDEADIQWLAGALKALGDFAIESLDPLMPTLKRLDSLLSRLDAVPDHERLYQELEDACRTAQREQAAEKRQKRPSGAPRRAGSKGKT